MLKSAHYYVELEEDHDTYSSFMMIAKSVSVNPILTQFCLLVAASPSVGEWKICWPVQSRSTRAKGTSVFYSQIVLIYADDKIVISRKAKGELLTGEMVVRGRGCIVAGW